MARELARVCEDGSWEGDGTETVGPGLVSAAGAGSERGASISLDCRPPCQPFYRVIPASSMFTRSLEHLVGGRDHPRVGLVATLRGDHVGEFGWPRSTFDISRAPAMVGPFPCRPGVADGRRRPRPRWRPASSRHRARPAVPNYAIEMYPAITRCPPAAGGRRSLTDPSCRSTRRGCRAGLDQESVPLGREAPSTYLPAWLVR